MKLDPTNTELLAQKQKLLSETVSSTKEKLDALKGAQQQVIEQFEQGKIGEEQYRAFTREVVKTEQELKKLKSELNTATRNLTEFSDNNGVAKEETQKLNKKLEEEKKALQEEKKSLDDSKKSHKEHSQEVENAKATLKGYTDKMKEGALAVGAATVAVTGYALDFSTEWDRAFNLLVTKTGAGKKELEALNTSLENVYKNNFGESIEDVAESMSSIRQQTKFTGEELEKATENAILMRDTFDMDVGESIRTVKMLMDQFGVSSEVAYSMLAQGAQSGLDKNGDLLDTINEYSVHFKQLGIESDEMFNMLINGAQNGTFSVDKLGDAVKEFGIRVKDGTADDAFKTLGLNVKQTTKAFGKGGEEAEKAMQKVIDKLFAIQDPIKQNELGVQLFGTMWEDLGVTGITALMNIQGNVKTTSETLNEINNQRYDDIGSSLDELGRTIQTDLIQPIGKELQPTVKAAIALIKEHMPEIKEVISGISEKVKEFFQFISQHSSEVKAAIAGIAAGLLMLNVTKMLKGVADGFRALNLVMKENPIGLIISLIATLITGLVTLYQENEDVRKIIDKVWTCAKEIIGNTVDAIGNFFKKIGDGIHDIIQGFIDLPKNIEKHLTNARNNIKEWVGNIVSSAKDTIAKLPEDFLKIGSNLVTGLWDGINNKIDWVIEKVRGFGSSIVSGIKNFFGIHSPSKKMKEEVGRFIAEGVADGIRENSYKAVKSAKEMGEKLEDQYKKEIEYVKKEIKQQSKARSEQYKKDVQALELKIEKENSSAKKQMQLWDRLRRKYKDGTDERLKADKKYYEAKNKMEEEQQKKKEEEFNQDKKRLEDKRIYTKITAQDEVNYWNNVRKKYKEGTEQRIEADKQYLESKKTLSLQLENIENTYAENYKKVTDDLKSNIQSLNDSYNNSIKSRTESILSSMNLFDEFSKHTDKTGEQLLSNLKGQVIGLTEWMNSLEQLKNRGISEDLFQELQQLGINSAGEIEALLGLTDEQLNEYVELWNTKSGLAKQQATKELTNLRRETDTKIEELIQQTNEDLEKYANIYRSAMEELGLELKKPIECVKVSVTEDGKIVVERFAKSVQLGASLKKNKEKINSVNEIVNQILANLPNQTQSVGANIIDGMIRGIHSQMPALKSVLEQVVNASVKVMQEKAEIHSPSRLFSRKIGEPLAQGISVGFQKIMDETNFLNGIPVELERFTTGNSTFRLVHQEKTVKEMQNEYTINIHTNSVDQQSIPFLVEVLNKELGKVL